MIRKNRHRRIIIGAVTSVVMIMVAVCGSAFAGPFATAAPSNTSVAQAWETVRPATSGAQVLAEVKAAQKLQTVPNDLEPGLTATNDGAGLGSGKCPIASGVMTSQGCSYGDQTSKNLMVIYGDSYAAMWGEALYIIAKKLSWRLVVYSLPSCQAVDIPLISELTNTPNTQCAQFHVLATRAIKKLHPNLLVVASEGTGHTAVGVPATPSQWQSGLMKTFASLSEPGTRIVMIGDIPQWPLDDADCLAAHMNSIQNCAVSTAQALSPNLQAEQRAANLRGVKYISTTAWGCASKCEPVVNDIQVYFNQYHFGQIYIYYLSGALEQVLGIPS